MILLNFIHHQFLDLLCSFLSNSSSFAFMLTLSTVTLSFAFPADVVRLTPRGQSFLSQLSYRVCQSTRHLWLVCVFRFRLFLFFFLTETYVLALLALLLSCVLLLFSSSCFSPCFNRPSHSTLPDVCTFNIHFLYSQKHGHSVFYPLSDFIVTF